MAITTNIEELIILKFSKFHFGKELDKWEMWGEGVGGNYNTIKLGRMYSISVMIGCSAPTY